MVMWTEEMRLKAAATRAETKRLKLERHQKREAARAEHNPVVQEVEATHGIEIGERNVRHNPASNSVSENSHDQGNRGGIDWELGPLADCLQRAAELKRDYERISEILVRRQNPANQHRWTCWTQENFDKVPASTKYNGQSVRSQCFKGGDGVTKLPKFTDNGNFEVMNGVRTLKPIHCCNFLCYSVYNATRVQQKVEAGR
jgi:hypothetical protein